MHNQARQAIVKLEKHWVTQNCWFRIVLTIIGMTVTDCWKAFRDGISKTTHDHNISVIDFADRLCGDLLRNNRSVTAYASKDLSPQEPEVEAHGRPLAVISPNLRFLSPAKRSL